MKIPYKIVIKEPVSKDNIDEIKHIVEESFQEIDSKLNGWNNSSEISLWNSSKSLEPIVVSSTLISILQICDTAYKMTEGAFDPTLGKITRAWKMSLRLGRLLSDKEVDEYAGACGWDKIVIGNNTLQKTHPDIALDLDGISKGYFCDICIEKLKNAGYQHILIEWGGEVKALGGPFNILTEGKITPITDTSIATSGPRYQLYPVSINGTMSIYSHFINPKTLRPFIIKNGYLPESFTTQSCALSDALATAYFIKKHLSY